MARAADPLPSLPRLPGREIARQAVATRRRLGLWMLGVGVALIGVQGLFEWLLPVDPMAAQTFADLVGWAGAADARRLALGWTGVAIVALAVLARSGPRALPWVALAAGLLLGSARVAAGGAAVSLALLLLAGVASLGWQSWRHGGAPLLGATAGSIAAWDFAASEFATLWPFCLCLIALFVWIEQRHIQASDRRLLSALRDRERLIADLDARGAELKRLQEARTQMLAGISHDLRQPLQAMRLYADALRPHCSDDEAAALLREQGRAGNDAVAMLDQFSEFSALEQGRVQVHEEVFDARQVLRDAAASLRASHPGARITDRGLPLWLRSDRTLFARVVQNLAGNAARHAAAARGADARVLIALRRRAGGAAALEVIDNGPGIPADKLELIFEPYVQLDGSRSGGRGLGLAIVRGLVDALGLALRLHSQLGRGSRFRIDVPATLRAPEPAVPAPAAEVAGTAWLGRRMFALLDDEEAPRLALAAALRGAGAHVVEAGRFETLQQRLDDELRFPDALLFDLDLRDSLDGLQAIEHLRAQWQSEVPALVITGRPGARTSIALPPRSAVLAKPAGLADVALALQPLMAG